MESTINIDAIEKLKILIKKKLNLEVGTLKEENNYINLIKICIESNISQKNKLLFILFHTLFIHNDHFKKSIDNDKLKAYEICIKDKVNEEEKKYFLNYVDEELDDFSYMLPDKMFSSDSSELLEIVCLIMKEKKEVGLFFQCFEIIMENKNIYYIPNKYYTFNFQKDNNFYLFNQLFEIIEKEIENNKDSNYFSLVCDGNKFTKIYLSEAEILKYLNEEKKDIKYIKSFIKNNSCQNTKSIKNNKQIKYNSKVNPDNAQQNKNNNNYNNIINKENLIDKFNSLNINKNKSNNIIQKDEDEDFFEKLANSLVKELNYQKAPNNILQEKYETEIQQKFKEKLKAEIKQKLEEKMNLQKAELQQQYEEKLNLQKAELQQFEDKLNSQKKEISSLKLRIKDMENEKEILKINKEKTKEDFKLSKYNQNLELNSLKKIIQDKEEEINSLNWNLDIIRSRGTIKGIIDILYAIYYELDLNKNYKDKKDIMKKKLQNLINEDKKNKLVYKDLYKFIGDIYSKKRQGDSLAHDNIELNKFFKIMEKYSCINILKELNLNNLLLKLNQFYLNNLFDNDDNDNDNTNNIIINNNKNNINYLKNEIKDLLDKTKSNFPFPLSNQNI